MSVESIKRRYERAKGAALDFRAMYRRAYELVAPHRNNFEWAPGQNKSPNVFDSSAALAADSFVNIFMNTVTPVHSRWVDLKAGVGMPFLLAQLEGNTEPSKEDLEEYENDINQILHELTENLFAYLNASNLYSELGSGYYDASIGTMVLLCMPGDPNRGFGSPIRFKAIPPDNFLLEEGAFGEISAIFRDICARARDVLAEWDDATGLDYHDDDDEVKLIESTIYNDKTLLWEYKLLQSDKVLLTRNYKTNPYTVFRYSTLPSEIFGRGPVLKAFPDIAMLNAAEELSIRAGQISTWGAHTVVADDFINPAQVTIIPGAMIPVKRNAGPSGPSIMPLPGIGNPNHQMIVKSDLQAKIRRFMLDDNLPGSNEPRMTATEVLERVRKVQRDFGSVFGRISYELVQPLIRRSIDVLVSQGVLQMPEILTRIDSFNVRMQIVSPVSRIQSLSDIEAVAQSVQMLGAISPDLVISGVRVEQLASWLADKMGAPLKLFKTAEEQREEQMELQQAQAQAQAQAQQEQQEEQQAQQGQAV